MHAWLYSQVSEQVTLCWRCAVLVIVSRACGGAIRASNVRRLARLASQFFDASSFNGDISTWNVASVTDMADMVRSSPCMRGRMCRRLGVVTLGWRCAVLVIVSRVCGGAIRASNVRRLARVASQFNDASSFNGDISSWNVASVTDMTEMVRSSPCMSGRMCRCLSRSRLAGVVRCW
jgi:surface protein